MFYYRNTTFRYRNTSYPFAATPHQALESKAADYTELFFILGNFIFLMCNNYDASVAFSLAFYIWSAVYLSVIALKMLLSLLAYGVTLCGLDRFFLIDAFVVVVAVGATYMTGNLKFAVSFIRVFRVPGALERLGLWHKSEMYLGVCETYC